MSRPRTGKTAPKLKAPLSAPAPAIRVMDLYGRAGKGGPLILWGKARPVMPISAFEPNGTYPWMIDDGHFVIDEDGVAITVHCGNMISGNISLQFMCSRDDDGLPYSMGVPRSEIEPKLLGKVIVTAEDRAMNREFIKALYPFVKRGKAPPPSSP